MSLSCGNNDLKENCLKDVSSAKKMSGKKYHKLLHKEEMEFTSEKQNKLCVLDLYFCHVIEEFR